MQLRHNGLRIQCLRAAALAGLLLLGMSHSAQAVPAGCKPIADEVTRLSQEVRDLQAELSRAATGAKSRLVAEIRALNQQLTPKRKELASCIAATQICVPKTVCTQDPATSDPRCKVCRRNNCDGSASVSHTC